MIAFYEKNEAEAVKYYEQLQSSESDPTNKLKLEASYLFNRYFHLTDPKALAKLGELSQHPNARYHAHFWIGVVYEDSDTEKAIDCFEIAAKTAVNAIERARAVIRSARVIYQVNSRRGFARIMDELPKTTDSEALSSYYSELGKLYERFGNPGLSAVSYEKALEASAE